MQNDVIQLPSAEKRGCDCCGAVNSVGMSYAEQKFNYGSEGSLVALSARVPVWTCSSCGDQYTDDKAEEIRHEVVCHHLGRLMPKDIRGLREAHDLTQAEFSEITGFGVASVKRWESGSHIQGLAQDRFMRLLRDQRTMQELRNLASQPIESRRIAPRFRTKISEAMSRDAKAFELRIVSGGRA